MAAIKVALVVNGERRELEGRPMERLLDLLRRELELPGSKEGCGEGECGACTVLFDGEPVLSCLVPLVQCEGRRVETVEAVAAGPAAAFVEAMVAGGGVQCGACTPGIVVTAAALLEREPSPGREEVREALAGNLCRCTGYEGIYRAFEAVGGSSREGAGGDAERGRVEGANEGPFEGAPPAPPEGDR